VKYVHAVTLCLSAILITLAVHGRPRANTLPGNLTQLAGVILFVLAAVEFVWAGMVIAELRYRR
jgi:hypothetical protein